MSYRRRHRWFRRMAFGLAFASVMFAGQVSVAAAKPDEGTNGSRYVSAGGWSGLVDIDSGIPLSAGIPEGDEQFIDPQAVQVIPYLSQGILTEADAQAAAAEAIHDPAPTDLFATQSQQARQTPYLSLGLADTYGDSRELPEPFVTRVTDSPRAQVDLRAVRPDDAADRFAHSDVATATATSDDSWRVEGDDALTVGIGSVVLALALGLGLGYLRRPRLAGP